MQYIPLQDRLTLTIEEAAFYYFIGERKLRQLTDDGNCIFVLFVDGKRLVKKLQFEEYLYRELYQ